MMTAEQLKKKRETLRLRQNQLAKLCSLTPAMMCRIEKGDSKMPGYVDLIVSLLERDEPAVKFAMERRGVSTTHG
jgi:predicted transcriptional regulator